jgi:hypothetical protein
MAHQLILVLIEDPHAKVMEQVEALIGAYSALANVAPYKQYLNPCDWDSRLCGEGGAAEFARIWEEKTGEHCEHDADGYYVWRDTNPDGRYKWYTVGGLWNGIFARFYSSGNAETDVLGHPVEGNICPVSALNEDYYPGSMVTPDGEWHVFGWRMLGEKLNSENAKAAGELIKQHSSRYAVAIDTHL